MMIDQNDWEFLLSLDSVIPQSVDDLFFHEANNTPFHKFGDEIPTDADANVSVAPNDDVSSWIGEMENFLMQDNDDGGFVDHDDQIANLEQILLSPSAPLVDKDSSNSKDSDSNSVPEKDETNSNCIPKSQIRKLRNRDAALRSRERKKSYVKDLEMKSKYMEAECRRLDRLLQFCYAENNMLRVSLHNATAFSGSLAKAESAVLLLESLLLVSLLWLLVTVCPLPPPMEAASLENANQNLEVPPPRNRGRNLTQLWEPLLFLSKSCKSSRTRMKVILRESRPLVCS